MYLPTQYREARGIARAKEKGKMVVGEIQIC